MCASAAIRKAAATFSATRCGCRGSRREESALAAEAWDIIDYLQLREVAHRCVADLPFGTQKRVELARALAARPKLLLLDEPAGGLNHHEVDELGALFRRMRDERRVTLLLVEHHMGLVMSISDRVVALDFGRKIAEGHSSRRAKESRRHSRLSRTVRTMTKPLLTVRGLNAFYGETQVLHGLDFEVAEGGITALLGANGAGKTSTLRALSGMIRATGEIVFDGVSICGRVTEEIARLGIAHVPEGRGTFSRMTVDENLQLGAMARSDRAGIAADIERLYGYFPKFSTNAAASRPARCPAASSRCWRSRAR